MNAMNMSFDDFAMGAISGDRPEFWDLIKMPENDYDRDINKLLTEEKDKKQKQWLIDAIESIDKQCLWSNDIEPLPEEILQEKDSPDNKKDKLWSDPKDEFGQDYIP